MSGTVQMMQPIGGTALFYYDAAVYDPALFTLVDVTPAPAITVGVPDSVDNADSIQIEDATLDAGLATPTF